MKYSNAVLLEYQAQFTIARMNRAKTRFSTEEKLKEGLTIQAAIKASPYQQQEVAVMVGYSPNAVSQWWHPKNPTRIPDATFVQLAEILDFDPSETRPWLLDMYKTMDKVFSRNNKSVSGLSILQAALEAMTPAERRQLIDRFGLNQPKS